LKQFTHEELVVLLELPELVDRVGRPADASRALVPSWIVTASERQIQKAKLRFIETSRALRRDDPGNPACERFSNFEHRLGHPSRLYR